MGSGRFALALAVACGMGSAAAGEPVSERPRIAVGAIRWDAWHGTKGGPGRAMEASLGPERYHWRLPFFADVRPDGSVSIDGTAQETMDREIEYAVRAGLRYWAFVTYGAGDAMSIGLDRYLSSSLRDRIDFCLVTECTRWGDPAYVRRLVDLIAEPGYHRTPDGRPLLFLGFIDRPKVERVWGGSDGFRAVLDGFRAAVRERAEADPYVVIMDFNAQAGNEWRHVLGGDAVSAYATHAGGTDASYADLARHAERFWDLCRETGSPVIPVCMAGWDRRPRIEHPVPWETWQEPGVGMDRFYRAPEPAELSAHVARALRWVRERGHADGPGKVLIYAWNENDEGGWLVPTRRADGSPDTRRVDALREVLGAGRTE